MTTNERWAEMIQHMTGTFQTKPRSKHGYRNHYCAKVGSDAHDTMLAMVEAGYVIAGRIINDGRGQYFHATKIGCEFAGLHKAAIKRATASA
jgi:hypothetical protein